MIALLASSPKNTVTLTRQRVVEVADPYNSPPPEIPRRSTKLAAINQLLGTFARKLASLKQYGLVRLASQAGSALSKHSRLSPLERALCSLFFANIASLHPPQAALR